MALTEIHASEADSDLSFKDNKYQISLIDNNNRKIKEPAPWKMIVIDDDTNVHQVTRMVLDDFKFMGRELEIVHGYSGTVAKKLIREHPDTAVLLLDVVMETDTAGLEVVRFIRNDLNNRFVRIILRTGQPGHAPEKEVISKYEINDYREKTELTAQKLYTCVSTALRAYHDLKIIESLAVNNLTLEQRVQEQTQENLQINQNLKDEVNERNLAYKKLKQSELRLLEAQRMAHIGNWEWDINSGELVWSAQIEKIIGIRPPSADETFNSMLTIVHKDDRSRVLQEFEKTRLSGAPYNIEHRVIKSDGRIGYVHQQGHAEKDKHGKIIRLAGTIQDISLRHETEEQMRKLSGAVEQIAESVMITDKNGNIEYVNPAFMRMTGYSRHEVLGMSFRFMKSGKQSDTVYERLWKSILSGQVFTDVIINRKKNGEIFYEEKTITPQTDQDGNIIHFISTSRDVTERIEAQERLHFMAHHDALTGLPNRVLLQDRLQQALARSPWHDRNLAIMFMDIDRFKVINDTLGHDVGDKLLCVIANRLNKCIREGDTVARLGGDEFAVVLNDVASKKDISPIANKILSEIKKPIDINQHELFVTTSIGISLFPDDGHDGQELLKNADMAMYRAKEQGKNNFQLFNTAADSQISSRLSMETLLRKALDRDEFTINYQPKISIATGKITGFEALLRWYNPQLKNVSPMTFIPILEETGMINEVGDWVLQEACRQAFTWHQAKLTDLHIAVNVSIRQFKYGGFVKRIRQILNNTGLRADSLELEVTEGLLIDQVSEATGIINDLNNMGVLLSIDDFGTGYSSMNYLKHLPFDVLKIDRTFIRDITNSPDDAAIASAIILLGHNLGMEVVAEGVETAEQLNYLRNHGCDAIQGFFYSPALTADAVQELIRDNIGRKSIFNTD